MMFDKPPTDPRLSPTPNQNRKPWTEVKAIVFWARNSDVDTEIAYLILGDWEGFCGRWGHTYKNGIRLHNWDAVLRKVKKGHRLILVSAELGPSSKTLLKLQELKCVVINCDAGQLGKKTLTNG